MATVIISAVLVSWNSLDFLPACLLSLRNQSLPIDEIIAVDNGSSDGSADWLRSQEDVLLIENDSNRGFAAANNQGLLAGRGDLVLLVNIDVELAPDYIERCLMHFADRSIGSVTGKLLRAAPAGTLDSTGHAVYGLGWAENRGEELPDKDFDTGGEVFGVCAAAAIYRSKALSTANIDGEVFDESYFSYIEDVDLDWRLRWLGWKAWYEPRAVAIHHRHASGARRSAPIMRHILKNRILTVVKNYDRGSLARNAPGLTAFTLAKAADFARIHPSAALGLLDAVKLLPQAFRKRAALRVRRVVEPARVRAWLLPFPWRSRIRRRMSRRRPAVRRS